MENENKKVATHKVICGVLTETYERKNNDYGDSFATVRSEVPNAILVRLYDKYSRLKTLTTGTAQKVPNESITDTLLDMANYCIMEIIEMYLEEEVDNEKV